MVGPAHDRASPSFDGAKAIAILEPLRSGYGADVKAMLRRHRSDRGWSADLAATRSILER